MIKRFLVYSFLICLFASAPAVADEISIGRVIAIDGQAKITGVAGRERVLALKSDVFMNDRIITAAGAKLQIRFSDDTIISQGENSEMTVDQYVYNPGKEKDVNCSMRMVRGVFRAITGKITELNPERFKVKTNLATIGIRGCELGFRLQANKEDVYIISLPPGDSVVIEKIVADETGRGGVIGTADRVLTIVNDSVAVTISAAGSLAERPLSISESGQLMRESTPSKSAGAVNETANNGDVSGGRSIKNAVDDNLAKNDQAVQAEKLLSKVTAPTAQQPSGGSSLPAGFTEPTTAPYVPPPPRPPSVMQGGGNMPGSMANWEWGVWADGTVEFYPNRAFGGTFLTGTGYQTIRDATPSRNLTGTFGSSSAVINGPGGYYNQLTGMGGVSIQVLIGSSVTPSWGGSFNLTGGGGDSLIFTVTQATSPTGPGGIIANNGSLSLNGLPATYTLVANSLSYGLGTLSAQSVNGNLTTKPSLGGDIGGVAGSFSFQHGGSGPRVNGAFGVDLN